MNSLTRFEKDFFPDFFRRFARVPMNLDTDAPGEIRIDVTEHDKEYEVRAEIPGAKKDDIRVTVDGNYVAIAAEVKREKEEKQGKEGRVLVKETYVGSSSRGFTLAHDIDDRNASAKYEDGVLKLTLPKREGSASRLLNIA